MSDEQRLRAAALYLRRHGWSGGGKLTMAPCMMQAWNRANNFPAVPAELRDLVGGSIIRFNDDHCKTIDDACAAFEIAADLAARE